MKIKRESKALCEEYVKWLSQEALDECDKNLSDEQKKISAANEMVRRIDRLFAIEAKLKADKKSPLEIKKIRQTDDYMKIVNDVYDYLHEINAEEGTPLDAAVKYFLNIESESKTFLLDGHIPISNNICERAIKPFAIMRRNVLFAKSEKGASISGRLSESMMTRIRKPNYQWNAES